MGQGVQAAGQEPLEDAPRLLHLPSRELPLSGSHEGLGAAAPRWEPCGADRQQATNQRGRMWGSGAWPPRVGNGLQAAGTRLPISCLLLGSSGVWAAQDAWAPSSCAASLFMSQASSQEWQPRSPPPPLACPQVAGTFREGLCPTARCLQGPCSAPAVASH